MTRTQTLGLAALAVAGGVVVALWRGLGAGSEEASVAVVPGDATSQPMVVVTVDELTAAAPDAPAATDAGETAPSARVELPDPLEPVVKYLRRTNPALYRTLTTVGARTLSEVDLGSAPIVEANLALLAKLPAVKHLTLEVADLSKGDLGPVFSTGIGSMRVRRVTASHEIGDLRFLRAPDSAR